MRNLNDHLKEIDAVVHMHAIRHNDATESLIQNYQKGYEMPKVDREKVELYRHGFCGEACDATLAYLKSTNIDTANIVKVHPNPEHFYLEDRTTGLIVDTTYKQFIYRLLIDTDTGKLKAGVAQSDVNRVDGFDGVFIGTLQGLESRIMNILKDIGREDQARDIFKIWRQEPTKAKPLVSYTDDQARDIISEACKQCNSPEEFSAYVKSALETSFAISDPNSGQVTDALAIAVDAASKTFKGYKDSKENLGVLDTFINLIKSLYGGDIYSQFIKAATLEIKTAAKDVLGQHTSKALQPKEPSSTKSL